MKYFENIKTLFIDRLVSELLKNEMTKIHAFSQKTYTPDEWAKKQEREAANPPVKPPSECLGGCSGSKNQ